MAIFQYSPATAYQVRPFNSTFIWKVVQLPIKINIFICCLRMEVILIKDSLAKTIDP